MANVTRSQLSSDSSTLFPDNTSQLISPADLRDWLTSGIDSFVTQKDVSTLENAIYEAKGSSLSAAATVNLASATGNYIHIIGAATISSFGTVSAGAKFLLVFDGICTLTYNATSLIIPGSANKTTAAGDACLIVSEGSGNWKIAGYFSISGSGGGGGITALTGDVTASGSGSVVATIANAAVDIAMLSATGTPSSSTFLRGDNTWQIPVAGYTSTVQHQVKLGENISKGQAVYVSSANGTNMIVSKASNATEATSSKTMGLIDATGVTNDFVNVITEGLLDGLDTSAASAAGDPVWLGTGGNLIYGLVNKPYAPQHLVFIGIVTRKNVSNGEIFVKVQNGFELKEIHDVQAQSPSLNDTIYFDSADSQWKTAQVTAITPAASASATGLVTASAQTLGGIKTFTNGASAGEIRLLEPSGSGTNYVAIKSQAMAADYSLTLPVDDGASGQVLQTDGSGLLSWVNQTASAGVARINATTTGTTITGTTAKTKTLSVLVPANTFGAGSILQISAFGIRTAGTTNGTMRIEVNTSDAIGGTLVASYVYLSVASNSWFKMYRELIISNSTTDTSGFPGATSAITDSSAVVASIASNAIDWTVNQYIVVSMQNGNAADSTYCRAISILQK